jgi:hypothetical protein
MDDHASATKIPSRNVRGRASALLACAMFGGVAVAQIEMRVNGGGGGAPTILGPGPG